MFAASALLAFVLVRVAAASPLAATTFRVHELRPAVPSGFTAVGPAPPQTTLSLRLALAQGDPDGLIDALYRVSDPDSETYGQYLSKEEVCTTMLPYFDVVDHCCRLRVLLLPSLTQSRLSTRGLRRITSLLHLYLPQATGSVSTSRWRKPTSCSTPTSLFSSTSRPVGRPSAPWNTPFQAPSKVTSTWFTRPSRKSQVSGRHGIG